VWPETATGRLGLLELRAFEIAAFVVEPLVQGAAGMLVHPSGFLAAAAALCRRFDVHLIVDEVATGSSFARFDGNTQPHHHLICRQCGSVADYYSTSLDGFTPSKGALDGFEVQSMKMNFFGICASCSDKQPTTARRKK